MSDLRDVVMADLRDMGVDVNWHCLWQNRKNWGNKQIVRRNERAPLVLVIREHQTQSFSVLVFTDRRPD